MNRGTYCSLRNEARGLPLARVARAAHLPLYRQTKVSTWDSGDAPAAAAGAREGSGGSSGLRHAEEGRSVA